MGKSISSWFGKASRDLLSFKTQVNTGEKISFPSDSSKAITFGDSQMTGSDPVFETKLLERPPKHNLNISVEYFEYHGLEEPTHPTVFGGVAIY